MVEPGRSKHRFSAHSVVGLLFVAGTLGAHFIVRAPAGQQGAPYIFLFLFLTGLMLIAWRLEYRRENTKWLLIAGVIARIVVLPVTPFPTHDVERYLWDGCVVLEGEDPYTISPGDDGVPEPCSAWPLSPEQRLPTTYMPGALAVFVGMASLGPTLGFWAWKVIATAGSLLILFAVYQLLKRLAKQRHLAVVALNPLLVLEAGIGSHVDVLPTLGIALAMWWYAAGRLKTASAVLGLAALVKPIPLLALVPLAAGTRDFRVGARMLLLGAGGFTLGWAAAYLVGLSPARSVLTFLGGTDFGSPLGALIDNLPLTPALVIAGLTASAGMIASFSWARRRIWYAVFLALSLPLLLSPAVFPWYLMPLVPPLVAAPTRFGVGWIAVAPLTYEVVDQYQRVGVWAPEAWPLVVMVIVWGVTLSRDIWVHRRH